MDKVNKPTGIKRYVELRAAYKQLTHEHHSVPAQYRAIWARERCDAARLGFVSEDGTYHVSEDERAWLDAYVYPGAAHSLHIEVIVRDTGERDDPPAWRHAGDYWGSKHRSGAEQLWRDGRMWWFLPALDRYYPPKGMSRGNRALWLREQQRRTVEEVRGLLDREQDNDCQYEIRISWACAGEYLYSDSIVSQAGEMYSMIDTYLRDEAFRWLRDNVGRIDDKCAGVATMPPAYIGHPRCGVAPHEACEE